MSFCFEAWVLLLFFYLGWTFLLIISRRSNFLFFAFFHLSHFNMRLFERLTFGSHLMMPFPYELGFLILNHLFIWQYPIEMEYYWYARVIYAASISIFIRISTFIDLELKLCSELKNIWIYQHLLQVYPRIDGQCTYLCSLMTIYLVSLGLMTPLSGLTK